MIDLHIRCERQKEKNNKVKCETTCNYDKLTLDEMSMLIYQLEYIKSKLMQKDFDADFKAGTL